MKNYIYIYQFKFPLEDLYIYIIYIYLRFTFIFAHVYVCFCLWLWLHAMFVMSCHVHGYRRGHSDLLELEVQTIVHHLTCVFWKCRKYSQTWSHPTILPLIYIWVFKNIPDVYIPFEHLFFKKLLYRAGNHI